MIGFAFVAASRDRDRIYQLVEQSVARWGFYGIKSHRLDAPITHIEESDIINSGMMGVAIASEPSPAITNSKINEQKSSPLLIQSEDKH